MTNRPYRRGIKPEIRARLSVLSQPPQHPFERFVMDEVTKRMRESAGWNCRCQISQDPPHIRVEPTGLRTTVDYVGRTIRPKPGFPQMMVTSEGDTLPWDEFKRRYWEHSSPFTHTET